MAEFLNPFVLPEFQNRYGTGLNGTRSGSGIYSWGAKLLPAARYGYTYLLYTSGGYLKRERAIGTAADAD